MSEMTISVNELQFIRDTLELAIEEMEGIEAWEPCDYTLTTGALEQCEELLSLVDEWGGRLR